MDDLVIVSDPGIDDAVALVLIEKLLPGVPKLLISTFGNAAGTITANNSRDIARLLGNNWRYLQGPELPLSGSVEHPWPDYFHGKDGLWNVETPKGSSVPTDHTFSYKHVLSLGPLTVIPDILANHKVEQLTIMGGAFNVPGNETPFAETNIAFDTDAAKLVFSDPHDAVVRVVPLDATRQTYWNIDKINSIVADSTLSSWLKQLLLTWNQNYDHAKEKYFNLHDPLAAFLSVYYDKVAWEKRGISVITEGTERGKTIFNDDHPPCYVATGSDDLGRLSDDIFSILFAA